MHADLFCSTSRPRHPVWADSTDAPVPSRPMPDRARWRFFRRARERDRAARDRGAPDSRVGVIALAVLHSLLFDFLNRRTGRLDPSHAALARAAGICVRAVATALARLRRLGLLTWTRRCASVCEGGRLLRYQLSNAYSLTPEAAWPDSPAWRDTGRVDGAPPPTRDRWGAAPVMPSALDEAAREARHGTPAGLLRALAYDDGPLARALASLGRAVSETGCAKNADPTGPRRVP